MASKKKPVGKFKVYRAGKAPMSNEGYEPRKVETNIKTGERKFVLHAGGPPRRTEFTYRNLTPAMASQIGQMDISASDRNLLASWDPLMKLTVFDEAARGGKGMALTAKRARERIEEGYMPVYFVNPYQDLDYLLFEMIMKHTFVGALLDALVKFIIGTGFKPELELINPDKKNPEKNEKEIADNQKIIDDLLAIDAHLDYDDNIDTDIPFIDKISALISHTLGYNRGALIFGYEKNRPFELNGKTYPDIPTSLRQAHPRELGIIKVSTDGWRLEAVQWQMATVGMVDSRDMIYLWNPVVSAKYRHANWYGGSVLMPMMDASRVLRQIIGTDFPAIARATWANPSLVVIRPLGQLEDQKVEEYQQVASNMAPGGVNILLENPENVNTHQIAYDPKIGELKDLSEFLIRYCVSCVGLPHSLFFDESASNRACYSADTLTLTEDGWKAYHEIDWRNEKIATLNPDNGQIEYHYPDGIAVYPYRGDMIHIKTKNQDIMVTPDHDMWVTRSHDPDFIRWEKVKAESLLEKSEWTLVQFGQWQGTPVPDQYQLASVNNHMTKMVQTVDTNLWLEFLGYYLSEGTKSRPEKHGHSYFVSIAQNVDSPHYTRMKDCIKRMPFNHYDNTNGMTARWRISSKQLVENLKDTGNLHNDKRVPRWILNSTPDRLQIIFDALMAGDGSVNKYGTKTYYTTSEQLAKDVQEIALKLGYSATVKTHYTAEYRAARSGRPVDLYDTSYRVTIRKEKGLLKRIRRCDIKRVPYDGNVYCFGVKNHLYVTSRGGTVTVQGNTMLGKIQLAISTVINPIREEFGRQIALQWYQRWFRILYKESDPETYKKFRIRCDWSDLNVEEWFDKIEAVTKLDARKPLKDGNFGDLMGIENYENMVDLEEVKKREQMGQMGGQPGAPGQSPGGAPKVPDQINMGSEQGFGKLGQDTQGPKDIGTKPDKPPKPGGSK